MADKFRTHHIIRIISSRRGIIGVAIGGRGIRGTNKVTIHNVIIVVFRISTTVVVVAVGIIIDVIFGSFVILIDIVVGIDESVILGVAFSCSIGLASG